MKYRRFRTMLISVITVSLLWPSFINAHCEIPCGIYNDQLRIDLIKEQANTIEKSMKQIRQLSKESTVNYNQLVRWIGNKEEHANKIQHIITQYFMTQRVKTPDPNNKAAHKIYLKKLSLLHKMLVQAMKTKQTTDLSHVDKLRALLTAFSAVYFTEKDKQHLKEHKK